MVIRPIFAICTIVLVAISGCFTGNTLTDGGTKVRLMKADPPMHCEELGGVNSYVTNPNNIEYSKTSLRNKAAKLGANYVRWDTVSTGTAYRCEGARKRKQRKRKHR